ncbi:MAG: hypothetical protein KAQ62_18660, partial [Cyclobacteriaceae bacterium]|nr:hypothetical protein [Cyclobacteriaceae bacterium]
MRITALIFLLATSIIACQNEQITKIDLSGEWQFQIDSLDLGIDESWYENHLNDIITLPGSMTTNGKGNTISVHTKWTAGIADSSWYFGDKYAKYREPGNVKIPFFLQPVKYYAGG